MQWCIVLVLLFFPLVVRGFPTSTAVSHRHRNRISEPQLNCWNHRGYLSLNACLVDCGLPITNTPPPPAQRDPSRPPTSYKVLHLRKGEYRLTGSNKVLKVLYPLPGSKRTFHHREYVVAANRRAYVCHPLRPEFTTCPKWVLDPDEFEILANGTLKMLYDNQAYDFGNYFIHKAGRAIACDGHVTDYQKDLTLI